MNYVIIDWDYQEWAYMRGVEILRSGTFEGSAFADVKESALEQGVKVGATMAQFPKFRISVCRVSLVP